MARHTPEYDTWVLMRGRCHNTRNPSFFRYGGRGITVCDRWMQSFDNFLADMGHKPSPKHSIDRIDNDGHYCPENCRWATTQQQAVNMSTNINITIHGQTRCLQDWCRLFWNVPYIRTYNLIRGGVDPLIALLSPPRRRGRPRAGKYYT